MTHPLRSVSDVPNLFIDNPTKKERDSKFIDECKRHINKALHGMNVSYTLEWSRMRTQFLEMEFRLEEDVTKTRIEYETLLNFYDPYEIVHQNVIHLITSIVAKRLAQ